MKTFKQFLISESETAPAGFKVRKPSPSEDEFFRKRTDVAGYYASGEKDPGGLEGTMVINPYNQYMSDPIAKEGLKRNEATRGIFQMEPDRLSRAPDLTPEQDASLDFYTKDSEETEEEKRNTRKATAYGRFMAGDTSIVGEPTPEQKEYSKEIEYSLNDPGYYGKIKAQRQESIPRNMA